LARESDPAKRLARGAALSAPSADLALKARKFTEAGKESSEADFQLLALLGEGGMGRVFEARQLSIDRTIAIKMIKPALAASQQQRQKFLAEAAVTGDLDHPNIVPIHDLGITADGALYYAMKRVRGTPWSKTIRNKETAENLDILMDVANAVAFAHSKGIIHRDLKPHNVMLGEFGEVFVMDWGLAASVIPGSRAELLTRHSAAGGTPAYMAPEMAMGDVSRIGFQSDIYLLGGILYEIVTGQHPHSGATVMECLLNAAANVIQPTDKKGELLNIALRAMSTEPKDRYQSVRELQQAIRDYQAHEESIKLCEEAMADLARAASSHSYADFSRAIFTLENSLRLWNGNTAARQALAQARLRYARCALSKGDLDLAASALDPACAEHAALAADIRCAQAERDARQRRLRFFRNAAIGLAAAVIVILSLATFFIRQEQRRAAQAWQEALRAQQSEEAQRRIAEAEREKAIAARNEEARQRSLAEAASAKAQAEEKKAREALDALIQAQSKEEEARAQAKAAEVMAAKAQDDLARSGMLLDNSWWRLTPDKARERQRTAAEALGWPLERRIPLAAGVELEMMFIPAGAFAMGSPAGESKRAGWEYLHRVEITMPFYLSRYELTEAQWVAIAGALPGQRRSEAAAKMPVTEISWDDVQQLLPKINRFAPPGFVFRLPTEAEWEYACRAGAITAYHAGAEISDLDRCSWYVFNSDRRVREPGGKEPNAWGLYDMHGNVAEWCEDLHDPLYYLKSPLADPVLRQDGRQRVTRGGSCLNLAEHCRCAYRSYANRDSRYKFLGVRLALAPQNGAKKDE